MKEITTQELKDIQLDIAVRIDRFCQERGLRYFLGYGSLIGAVRHKGFIPWDDDIDLGMPRPDYETFVRTFNGACPGVHVTAPETEPGFCMPFAYVYREDTLLAEEKITYHGFPIGVKVDVFPIDGAPSNDGEYFTLRKKLHKWNTFLFYKNVLTGPRWKTDKVLWLKTLVWKCALLPLSIPAIQRHIRALATAHDFATSERSDKLSFPNPGNTRMYRSVFEHYMDIEFEGCLFKTLRDYDVYQRAIYGDYMQLPPPSQRIPKHGFHAYWK